MERNKLEANERQRKREESRTSEETNNNVWHRNRTQQVKVMVEREQKEAKI